jgi:hypothetical protein
MSARRDRESALFTKQERADVDQTRYPEILQFSWHDLVVLIRRLREHEDRAQTISRRQGREICGKAAPHGGAPSRDNLGTIQKAQVFAQAVSAVTPTSRGSLSRRRKSISRPRPKLPQGSRDAAGDASGTPSERRLDGRHGHAYVWIAGDAMRAEDSAAAEGVDILFHGANPPA